MYCGTFHIKYVFYSANLIRNKSKTNGKFKTSVGFSYNRKFLLPEEA